MCVFYLKQYACEVLPAIFSYYPQRVLLSPCEKFAVRPYLGKIFKI